MGGLEKIGQHSMVLMLVHRGPGEGSVCQFKVFFSARVYELQSEKKTLKRRENIDEFATRRSGVGVYARGNKERDTNYFMTIT